ncbi:T9SS type B sorting domain-containing protein [Dyadobacter psychrotolerans]|uniref:Gliding motility-associated C-terminal domain-containing protein n=1 Tax=Dyadobacter psychrotolerans TaxID=2541721 RepID=A0A4R5DM52_9BACT|nr:gliding motility-associated C-terminal domain-containing protein [Dyadobacter psychrotolerans]TDE15199.1 gliding motility-associated C-terminal domain-containing protein [Dyadobacter psychrotolerans]
MKKLLFKLFLLTPLLTTAQENIGFERSNFDGWVLSHGQVFASSAGMIFKNEVAGTLNDGHKIMSLADGRDPKVGIATVAPGSRYSVRIGNAQNGNNFDKISTSFFATEQNSLFRYQFAVVMEDPGHDKEQQPAFSITVQIDGQTSPCGFYEVASGRGIPGFQAVKETVFRDWTTGSIDLRQYIGKRVTISIRTNDCTQGAHWGYGYFDSELTKAEVKTVVYCQEDSTVVLSAPEGFSGYEWFNGQKTRQIKTKVVKDQTIFVNLLPFSSLGEDCRFRLDFKPVLPLEPAPITVSGCEGETLLIANKKIKAVKSETIYIRIPRAGYCDSIQTVHLNITPRPVTNQQLTICEGDFILVGTKRHKQTGIYSDTLKVTGRCDSIVNTQLTLKLLARSTVNVSICEEEYYTLGDTLISHSGRYTRRIHRLNLCDSIATVHLSVKPIARTQIERLLCQGDSILIGSTFLNAAGTFTVRIQRSFACDSIVTISIQMRDKIPLSQSAPQSQNFTLTLGQSRQLSGEINAAGIFTYNWTADKGILDCASCPSNTVSPIHTTNYVLTYNEGSTCQSSTAIRVVVKPCPMSFPDVFTPNGDNKNEVFQVFCDCIGRIENYQVYNRWGEVIYALRDTEFKNNLWNGFTNSQPAPIGLYYFTIKVRYSNGEQGEERGAFRLAR